MQRKPSTAFLLIAILACFLTGILSVVIRRNSLPTTSISDDIQMLTQSPSTKSLDEGAYDILILGVDEVVDPNPELLAVWYISVFSPDEIIHLRGYPTDYVPPILIDSLAESFTWSAISGFNGFDPGPFEPQAIADIWAIIILDREGFAVVIDYLGGISLQGEKMDGAAVVGLMSMLAEEPTATLTMQAEVVKALISEAHQVGTTPELTALTSLIPEHASVSKPPGELASLAIPYLPIQVEGFIVETWSAGEEEP